MTEPNQVDINADKSVTEPNQVDINADAEPTEETLRQITGAPDINQPLVSKDAFADIDVSSSRPVWKLPLPQFALIAIILGPVFGLAGYFLAGSRTAQQQAAIPSSSEETKPDAAIDNTELLVATQEIARLKSQMALADQAYVQESQRSVPAAGEKGNQASESMDADAANETETKPQSVTVATSSTPPTVSYSPSPPPIPSRAPDFSTATGSSATSGRFVTIDPFEQWRQLAQLGSYGNITNGESERNLETTITSVGNDTAVDESSVSPRAVPTAYFAATSATGPSSSPSLTFQRDISGESEDVQEKDQQKPAAAQPDSEEGPKTEEPTVLTEAESRILEDQTWSSVSSTQSLIAGGYAAGEFITPVVLDNEGVENRFMVVLSEPLTDNASRTAIPAGALLVVRVDRVAENGLVQLSATEAVWEDRGFQKELVLPSQTLLIRGNGGNPLVAKSYGDIGSDIAAMDLGQFALGAIRRVGELYTRSDSRVQTGDGTTVITESNPTPNILAGVLEGGSDAILDAISNRNQEAIERLREQPRVPYIPAGSSIQIFVNQSMQMPASF